MSRPFRAPALVRPNLVCRWFLWQDNRGLCFRFLEQPARLLRHQRQSQHVVHVRQKLDVYLFENLWRNLLEVLGVFPRNQHGLDQGTMCGKNFFLQPSNWEDAAPESDLASHSDIASDRNFAE